MNFFAASLRQQSSSDDIFSFRGELSNINYILSIGTVCYYKYFGLLYVYKSFSVISRQLFSGFIFLRRVIYVKFMRRFCNTLLQADRGFFVRWLLILRSACVKVI